MPCVLSSRPRVRETLTDLALVGLGQLLIGIVVRSLGFASISDDDFARVVIAQQFATSPSWDPSGTSWLPFPFLLQGTAMLASSATLETARVVALCTSVLAAAMLYAAARVWKISRTGSVLATLFAAAIPYSARLSVATVPEYLTASLLVLSATTLAHTQRKWIRIVGGCALLIACASRYEAWPAALGFSLVQCFDARSPKVRPWALAAAATALCFPLLWMVHGIGHHQNALFFVKRVVDYKTALGGSAASHGEAALAYLTGVLAEPEVVLACLAVGLMAWKTSPPPGQPKELLRVWLPSLVLLSTLLVGALRGGAPTHHSERALLSLWLLGVVSVVSFVLRQSEPKRWIAIACAGALLGSGVRLLGVFDVKPFADRRAEVRFGAEVLSQLPPSEPIALALRDYGYFAVMAAAGHPSRFFVAGRHDPRHHEDSEKKLQSWLGTGGCFIVTHEADAKATRGTIIQHSGPFVLVRAQWCSRKKLARP